MNRNGKFTAAAVQYMYGVSVNDFNTAADLLPCPEIL